MRVFAYLYPLFLISSRSLAADSPKPSDISSFIVSGNSWTTNPTNEKNTYAGSKFINRLIRLGSGLFNRNDELTTEPPKDENRYKIHFSSFNNEEELFRNGLLSTTRARPSSSVTRNKDFRIEVIFQNYFVHADSIFWFWEDGALYISDNYGGKFLRLKEIDDQETFLRHTFGRQRSSDDGSSSPSNNEIVSNNVNFKINYLRLPREIYGSVGPIVPFSGSSLSVDEVEVLIGYNTKLNTRVFWNLTNENQLADELREKFRFPGRQNLKNRRYQRFSFGVTDPKGRVFTGAVDVRNYLDPYPCDNDLLYQNIKGSRRNRGIIAALYFLKLNTTEIICQPGGVAFDDKRNKMYYVDHHTKVLMEFFYDEDRASASAYKKLIYFKDLGISGQPSGLALDTKGYLWIGFRGSGQIIQLHPRDPGSINRLITVPQPDVTDIAFDNLKDTLYVLTRRSLYALRNIGAQGVLQPGYA